MDRSPDAADDILANLVGMNDLEEAVRSGDVRKSLIAIRDYVAHELVVNRCPACMASKLRTGDTAALVLRLTAIVEQIAALPVLDDDNDPIMSIMNRRG